MSIQDVMNQLDPEIRRILDANLEDDIKAEAASNRIAHDCLDERAERLARQDGLIQMLDIAIEKSKHD